MDQSPSFVIELPVLLLGDSVIHKNMFLREIEAGSADGRRKSSAY